ncbi:glycosyltransferase family 2 protein [Streptococcus suis]
MSYSQSNGEKMKFSIIMPVYNTALYLKKSIQSVIEQTYENWELICVNDGSTDDSLEICEHYAKQDSRIKVFSKVNEGVSVARNFGLKKVTGERVIFLDADDWLASNTLEVFSKYPLSVDFIIANHFEVFTNGYTKAKKINVSDIASMDAKDRIIEFCVRESQWRKEDWYGYLRPVWGKCFSRELIEKSNVTFISGLKYGEDMVFLLSYLLECRLIAFTNESLYYYNRTNEGSAMVKRSWMGQEQGLLYFREVERLVKNRVSEETLSDLWLETAEWDWKVLLKSKKSFVAKYAIFKNLISTDLYRRFSEKTDYQEIGKKKKLFIFAIKHKQPMLLMLLVTLNNMRG